MDGAALDQMHTDPVLPARFDTRDQPPAEQFDAWHDHYRKVFDLHLADGPAASYPAQHTSWTIRGLTLTRASMPPNVMRYWRHWARPEIDDWILAFAPDALASPAGLKAQSVGFRSLPRRFESYGQDGEVITLFLPRDEFREQAAAFDRAPHQIPYAAMTSLFVDYLLALEARLPWLSERELEGVADATKSLLTACIAPISANLERARSSIAQAIVDRARKLVRQNLGAPDLGPDKLARSLGTSRSALYRAFEPHGGVASFILQERLDEAHRRLSSTTREARVGTVALDLGFSDHSTFSRAFKRRFGYSPRDAIEWET